MWLVSISVLSLMTGCLSTSTLQTAKVLDKGTARIHIGGGLYNSPTFDDAVDEVEEGVGESTDTIPDLVLPYLEFAFRYGVIDKLEIGGKLTVPGALAVDGKYGLLDDGTLALATGLAVGHMSSTDGDEEANETTIFDIVLPVYASYHPAEAFALYASPKYLMRIAESTSSHVGITGGFKLGKSGGVFFEATYLTSLSEDFITKQYSGSLFFDF